MSKKLPPIEIGPATSSSLELEGAKTTRTFLTSPQRYNTRNRSKSQCVSARKPRTPHVEHPIFLYLEPAINEFATFTAVLRDFATKTCIEQSNQQLLYQFGHVQTSFSTFTAQAKLYFNKAWQGSKPNVTLTTGALYRSGKELVENWIDLIKLSNQSLDAGILPLFKILYDQLNDLHECFNQTYRAVKIYSMEDSMFIEGKKNFNERLNRFKSRVIQYVIKDKPPGPSFDEQEFSKECRYITDSLAKFIIPIPPSLSMKSAEIMRDRTKLQYTINEVNRLCNSIEEFRKASTAVKISLYHTNEVLSNLMEKLDFPFEFHIKFDKVSAEEEKRLPQKMKTFDSTQDSIKAQLNEIANMFNEESK